MTKLAKQNCSLITWWHRKSPNVAFHCRYQQDREALYIIFLNEFRLTSKKEIVHRFLITILFVFIMSGIFGQDTLQNHKFSGIGLSYYAENFSHYGFRMTTEYSLSTKNIVKTKK